MSTFLNIQYEFVNNDNGETLTLSDTPFTTDIVLLQKMPKGLTSAEIRQDEFPLSGRDGISTGDAFLGKKVITFEALLMANTENDMNALIDKVRTVFMVTQTRGINKTVHKLNFTDIDGVAKYLDYQIQNLPEFEKTIDVQGEVVVLFSIFAEDPRYYSQTEHDETLSLIQIIGGLQVPAQVPAQLGVAQVGGATIANAGNFKSYPIITITGPCTNPIVQNVTNNMSLKYDTILNAGEQIVCNCGTGETTRNGTDNSDELADDSQFIELFAGNNYLVYTDDTLNLISQCLVQWRDVWI